MAMTLCSAPVRFQLRQRGRFVAMEKCVMSCSATARFTKETTGMWMQSGVRKQRSMKRGVLYRARVEEAGDLSKRKIGSGVSPDSSLWLPALCLVGLTGISFLATGPSPDNPLLYLDHRVQEWVVMHIPESIQSRFFSAMLSDLPIQLDLVCGGFLLIMLIQANRQRGLLLSILCSVFFFGGVGSHHRSGLLVDVLKGFFHRVRPGSHLPSFSFPSGHLMSVTFLTFATLYVLLPAVVVEYNRQRRFHWGVQWMDASMNDKSVLGAVICTCTAIGRVGANAHWVSDTIAGFLIGIILVFLFKSVWTKLDNLLS